MHPDAAACHKEPAATPIARMPQDYTARVKATHESGGYGSIGYGYNWATSEAEKNLLRTHTTAVSSKMLYKLAQDGFKSVLPPPFAITCPALPPCQRSLCVAAWAGHLTRLLPTQAGQVLLD